MTGPTRRVQVLTVVLGSCGSDSFFGSFQRVCSTTQLRCTLT